MSGVLATPRLRVAPLRPARSVQGRHPVHYTGADRRRMRCRCHGITARGGGRNRPGEARISLHPSSTPRPSPQHHRNLLILISESVFKVSEITIHLANPGSVKSGSDSWRDRLSRTCACYWCRSANGPHHITLSRGVYHHCDLEDRNPGLSGAGPLDSAGTSTVPVRRGVVGARKHWGARVHGGPNRHQRLSHRQAIGGSTISPELRADEPRFSATRRSDLDRRGSRYSQACGGHRGMASMGVLLTISICLTIFCYLIVLPALLTAMTRPAQLRA